LGSVSIVCPHCAMGTAVEFRVLEGQYLPHRIKEHSVNYAVDCGYCQNPACGRLIIRLTKVTGGNPGSTSYVVPRASTRVRLEGIPAELYKDYEEACAVLDTSPAASAALARRRLQGVIHDHFEIKEKRLHDEIERVAGLQTVPPYLADGLHRIRDIGNLAAHPAHDRQMGIIVNVSREEAEWTLEMLESLFRHCHVDPIEYERRTGKLREKLDRARADSANPSSRAKDGALQNRGAQA